MTDKVYKMKPKESAPEEGAALPEPTMEERLFWHCRRIESIKKAISQNEKRQEMAWEEFLKLKAEYVDGFISANERLTVKLEEAEGVLCDMLMTLPEKKRKYKMGGSTYFPATSPAKVVIEDEAGAVEEVRATGREGLTIITEKVDKTAWKKAFPDEESSPPFEFIKRVPGKTSLRTRRN